MLRENQLLVKEIAMKYATDSESWNRQKQKLQEKEKLVILFVRSPSRAQLINCVFKSTKRV